MKQGGETFKVKKLIVLICLAALMCFGFVGCKEESNTTASIETMVVDPVEEAVTPVVEEITPVLAKEIAPTTRYK